MRDNFRQGVFVPPRYEVMVHLEKISGGWSMVSGENTMNAPMKNIWDGTERRKVNSCRRVSNHRTNQNVDVTDETLQKNSPAVSLDG
jgi:hypothetical protein